MAIPSQNNKWRRCAPGFFLVVAFLTVSGIGNVSAEEAGKNFFLDRSFYVAGGAFFAIVDSEVRLDPTQSGSGTTINLDDLGLGDTSATPWLEARWRFAHRHMIEFEGIRLSQDGTASAQTTLIVGDTQANVGASLDTELDLSLGRLTYGYSFLKDERKEATFLVGAHVARLEFSTVLSGDIEDVETGASLSGTLAQEGDDLTVPLPHVGGRFAYAFSPRLVADASAFAFYLKFQDVKGSLVELQANVHYRVWEHVSLGAGVRYFDFNVEDDQTNGSDEFNYNYWGPVVFIAASF